MDNDSTGHTAQSGRIIELTQSAQPQFFSEKIGRDYGNPAGGWTEHRSEATSMSEQQAQRWLDTALAGVAPNCRIVEAGPDVGPDRHVRGEIGWVK